MKKILNRWICFFCMTLCIWSCSDDEGMNNPHPEVLEVPLSFELVSQGKEMKKRNQTRPDTLKVNPRFIDVDEVLVTVYRRESDRVYKDSIEGFVREQAFTLPAVMEGTAEKQPRFVARGSIELKSGFTYRMTAIAYSKKREEDKLFRLNEPVLSYAEVELLDLNEYKTPELFFGTVVHLDKDTLFSYAALKESKANLTGWLYRGVAGVELRLGNIKPNIKKIELLADSIHTRVKARYYDDFHNGYAKQCDGSFQHFVIGSYERGIDEVKNDTIYIVGPNLIEVCTSLSLRITLDKEDESGTTEQVVTRLRVHKASDKEDKPTEEQTQPSLRLLPDDGGNGTGIIPDNNPDPDQPENPDDPSKVNPYRICFKRNNYYIFKGDFQKLTTLQYVLQVSVNPNWEGSINLPLDKS